MAPAQRAQASPRLTGGKQPTTHLTQMRAHPRHGASTPLTPAGCRVPTERRHESLMIGGKGKDLRAAVPCAGLDARKRLVRDPLGQPDR
jgi:hypothetical protein